MYLPGPKFMQVRSFHLYLGLIFAVSCSGEVSHENNRNDGKIKDHLVNANRIFVENEAEQIDSWILRHKLKMKTSGTGLRYLVFPGELTGNYAGAGDSVDINYSVYLLDGTLCYQTENKPERFILGKADIPRGMDEALQMMHKKDSCVIVLPAHLAYGFTGDGDKIPGNSTTVYYIALNEIIKP